MRREAGVEEINAKASHKKGIQPLYIWHNWFTSVASLINASTYKNRKQKQWNQSRLWSYRNICTSVHTFGPASDTRTRSPLQMEASRMSARFNLPRDQLSGVKFEPGLIINETIAVSVSESSHMPNISQTYRVKCFSPLNLFRME